MALEVKLVVSGVVQGVGYRAHCREIALQAGVTGYADNLPDGSVEVLACGEEKNVLEFLESLWKTKPAEARIDSVKEIHRGTCEFKPPSFRIL